MIDPRLEDEEFLAEFMRQRVVLAALIWPPSPHLFAPPQVRVSPRRQMDVPDRPGQWSSDFEGCVS